MVIIQLDLDITAPQYFVDKMAVKRSEEQKIRFIRLAQYVVFYYTAIVGCMDWADSHEFVDLLNEANLSLDDSLKPDHYDYGLCFGYYYKTMENLKLARSTKSERYNHELSTSKIDNYGCQF